MMWYMLLVSTLRGLSINLFSFLFGNILLISIDDMKHLVRDLRAVIFFKRIVKINRSLQNFKHIHYVLCHIHSVPLSCSQFF